MACQSVHVTSRTHTYKKHFIICGPEFGLDNVRKTAIIVRALYGGKSAEADYWRDVEAAMTSMSFITRKADPDVWMRPSKRGDGSVY